MIFCVFYNVFIVLFNVPLLWLDKNTAVVAVLLYCCYYFKYTLLLLYENVENRIPQFFSLSGGNSSLVELVS